MQNQNLVGKAKFALLIGIFILAFLIYIKPVETVNTNKQSQELPTFQIDSIIQIDSNRIGIVDFNRCILVFEYNSDEKKFIFVTSFSYADYFSNPQNYGIPDGLPKINSK